MEPTKPTREPHPLPSGRDYTDNIIVWKEFVKELKGHWKHLWRTRIDDKVRAEGIASNEFPKLFIEKGTVIIATKDYRPPSFHEILGKYTPQTIMDQVDPSPLTGGMGKFAREVVRSQKISRRDYLPNSKPRNQQRKHGGRGWLH